MKMIIGGAYQGKVDFACEHFGLLHSEVTNGSTCDFDDAFTAKCIKSYSRLIARLTAQGVDPVQFTERLCEENKDVIIVLDEIGCGIVPVEKSERKHRETTGRCGCIISKASDTVVRVACGIPVYLKGGSK